MTPGWQLARLLRQQVNSVRLRLHGGGRDEFHGGNWLSDELQGGVSRNSSMTGCMDVRVRRRMVLSWCHSVAGWEAVERAGDQDEAHGVEQTEVGLVCPWTPCGLDSKAEARLRGRRLLENHGGGHTVVWRSNGKPCSESGRVLSGSGYE